MKLPARFRKLSERAAARKAKAPPARVKVRWAVWSAAPRAKGPAPACPAQLLTGHLHVARGPGRFV